MKQALKKMMEDFAKDDLTWAQLEGMSPNEAQDIARLACELAESGRLEDSRVLLEGLAAGNPKDASVRAALGTVYQKLQRPEDALKEYEAALRWDARHPVALANRGELRLMRGDDGGCADLAEAVRWDPEGKSAGGRRAKALMKALALRTANPTVRSAGP